MNKKILTMLAIFPTVPAFAHFTGTTSDNLNDHSLQPGETVYLNVNSDVEIQIAHSVVAKEFSNRGINTTLQKIKVRFHEENNDIDFTSLDGHTFTVPLDLLAVVPPNLDGRGN